MINNQMHLMVKLLMLSIFIFLLPLKADSDDKKSTYFVSEMWSGEGRPKFRAKNEVRLHTEPNDNSPLTNTIIKKGALINFASTRYITVRPTEIVLGVNEEFPDATNYGRITYLSEYVYYNSGKRIQLHIEKGQKIRILQYRAEGEYLFEYKGNIYGAICQICQEQNEPGTEWWIKVDKAGVQGWLKVNSRNVSILE